MGYQAPDQSRPRAGAPAPTMAADRTAVWAAYALITLVSLLFGVVATARMAATLSSLAFPVIENK